MAQTAALNPSLSLTEKNVEQSIYQKIGGICIAIAILALVAALAGAGKSYPATFLSIIIGMFALGAMSYAIPYYRGQPGIRNNGIMFKKMTNRGTIAWILAIALTGFTL
jgi:hypothetical protein